MNPNRIHITKLRGMPCLRTPRLAAAHSEDNFERSYSAVQVAAEAVLAEPVKRGRVCELVRTRPI